MSEEREISVVDSPNPDEPSPGSFLLNNNYLPSPAPPPMKEIKAIPVPVKYKDPNALPDLLFEMESLVWLALPEMKNLRPQKRTAQAGQHQYWVFLKEMTKMEEEAKERRREMEEINKKYDELIKERKEGK